MSRVSLRGGFAIALAIAGCTGGLPDTWRDTPPGVGPRVRWDVTAEPLPEIPLPNDIATWPDPTSPTGRRVNASMVAPTGMEQRLRERFDSLDGWGTYAPITIGFTAPIDTDDLIARQGRGKFAVADWARHAIYLVDLETGVPVPLDVNSGLHPYAAAEPDSYHENDPHADGSNLIFETNDEDTNANGVLDRGEDIDFDGQLDRPNTFDGRLTGEPHETIDRMLFFYERESDTMLLRPLLPMREAHTYAVVITDRLRGRDGGTVRSPFDAVHHVAQYETLAPLPQLFADHAHLYGADLAADGWEHVAFAWSFTTQSVTGDLDALREGLYGRGPFARLSTEFPARIMPVPVKGASRGRSCDAGIEINQLYTAAPEQIQAAFAELPIGSSFGIPQEQVEEVLSKLSSIDYFVYGFFESPYLLGDPAAEDVNDTWQIDRQTGEARIDRDLVPVLIAIPKTDQDGDGVDEYEQPFPVTMYAHGYGSLNLEMLAFAGVTAQHGIASVSIDAQGHGLPLGPTLRPVIESVLGASCLARLGSALTIDRARDLNADTVADSAGLYFSAYMFHTRDTLRQSVLDILQAVRIVRSFTGAPGVPEGQLWTRRDGGSLDGCREALAARESNPDDTQFVTKCDSIPHRDPRGDPLVFDGDVDQDGDTDVAGDFDGNGVPDLGGWDRPMVMWGTSLGGILTMTTIGVEPNIVAAAPVSGGGGLFDIGLRTDLGTAQRPIWLRVMGPIIVSVPVSGPDEETGCLNGQRSLRFIAPDLNDQVRIEFGCMTSDELAEGDAVRMTNGRNGEVRCAGVGTDGRFRIELPSDVDDPLRLEVFSDGALAMDYATCTLDTAAEPSAVVDTWESTRGPDGAGRCRRCATYHGRDFAMGSPLVAPFEGLGLSRQSQDLRRLSSLAQIALDPADPINYARRVFLDPVTAEDVPEGRLRSILVMVTAGDTTVPPSTGNGYARAAGILPFLPPDGPDELADWRAPRDGRVMAGWGVATPADVLIDQHVLEGIARLGRHPIASGPENFVYDVDDLAEGLQRFAPDGEHQVPMTELGFAPPRLAPPLRWRRDSRPAMGPADDVWRAPGAARFEAVSGVLNAMIIPSGNHIILPVDPFKPFDEGEYLINLIGWYLASGGREIVFETNPTGHHCLEDSSCIFGLR